VTKANYLVVDCGGGTVDIAAHKMTIDEKGEILIEELTPPQGRNCGGFAVNKEFESMLQEIFGISNADFKSIKEKHSRHWMKMIWSDFEESKCSIKPGDETASITIAVHKSIRQEVKEVTGKSIESLVKDYKKQEIEWDDDDDCIILPYSTIYNLYKPALAIITTLIDGVLSKCGCIEMVLLVGGFAESSLLFDEVKESIAWNYSSIDVKRIRQPVFSVAIGAVIFGQNKDVIKSRVMKHSIGVEACVEFNESEHDQNYIRVSGGETYCDKIFYYLAKANQSVYTGLPSQYLFRPLSEEQRKCIVSIYESPKEDIKYITDDSCHLMGTIEIDIPKCTADESREIKLVIDFAKTEFTFSAFSGTGSHKQFTTRPTFFHTNKYLPSV